MEHFISYAQNYEDVMLWRALKDVPRGFYIDVGAWSPEEDSVTRAFYERDWRGINVEPNPNYRETYAALRPRDINLDYAVSDYDGRATIQIFDSPGLSTLDDAAADLQLREGMGARPVDVPVLTLASLWTYHVPQGQEVHFLKVDVEGLEEKVIRGNDWSRFRPWILVIEATQPMSQVECHQTWEPLLTANAYQLAYSDGLNRFYVAEEHGHLKDRLKFPPNVFDYFLIAAHRDAIIKGDTLEFVLEEVRARKDEIETWALSMHKREQELEVCLKASEALVHSQKAQIAKLDQVVKRIYASLSWRVTAPLRSINYRYRRLRERVSIRRGKTLVKRVLMPFARLTLRLCRARPGLALRLQRITRLLGLPDLLLHFQYWVNPTVPALQTTFPRTLVLSPGNRRIYDDIRAAMGRNGSLGE